MQEWLINLSRDHTIWVYVFIAFLSFAEGPILAMVSGVIIKLGYFGFAPIYLALMIGDLIGDIFWYYVGYFHGHRFIRRFGKYFDITEYSVEKIKDIFHRHKHPIIFVSKITNGFGFALATLITAGMVRLPFSKYFMVNLIGQFIWTGFLISVGYFFGDLYLTVDAVMGKVFIIALLVFLTVAFLRYRRYLQNKIKHIDYL